MAQLLPRQCPISAAFLRLARSEERKQPRPRQSHSATGIPRAVSHVSAIIYQTLPLLRLSIPSGLLSAISDHSWALRLRPGRTLTLQPAYSGFSLGHSMLGADSKPFIAYFGDIDRRFVSSLVFVSDVPLLTFRYTVVSKINSRSFASLGGPVSLQSLQHSQTGLLEGARRFGKLNPPFASLLSARVFLFEPVEPLSCV